MFEFTTISAIIYEPLCVPNKSSSTPIRKYQEKIKNKKFSFDTQKNGELNYSIGSKSRIRKVNA